MIELAAQALAGGLGAIFGAAVLHKLGLVVKGLSRWHPLLALTPWRRRHARSIISAALIAEIAMIALLVADPRWGLVAAVALLLVYTFELRKLDPGSDCQCLGASTTSQTAVWRNLTLLAGSLFVLSVIAIGSVSISADPTASGAAALVTATAIAGWEGSRRVLPSLGLAKGVQNGQ